MNPSLMRLRVRRSCLIIVADKLLTGFDAPRNITYLYRSLKEHSLLQAIARALICTQEKTMDMIDYWECREP